MRKRRSDGGTSGSGKLGKDAGMRQVPGPVGRTSIPTVEGRTGYTQKTRLGPDMGKSRANPLGGKK